VVEEGFFDLAARHGDALGKKREALRLGPE
jgi:hypothetical protein